MSTTEYSEALPEISELESIRYSGIGFVITSPPVGPVRCFLTENGWGGTVESFIPRTEFEAASLEEAVIGLAARAVERYPDSVYAFGREGEAAAPAPELEAEKPYKTLATTAEYGLTELELHLIDLSSDLANGIARMIRTAPVTDDGTASKDKDAGDNDWDEVAGHIHVLQSAIMSQAAARDHPRVLRLKGASFPQKQQRVTIDEVNNAAPLPVEPPSRPPFSRTDTLIQDGVQDSLIDGLLKAGESAEAKTRRLEGADLSPKKEEPFRLNAVKATPSYLGDERVLLGRERPVKPPVRKRWN